MRRCPARLRYARVDLLGRQHTAFTGLGTLADLDLDQTAGIQEFSVDAETTGRDLLTAVALVFPINSGTSPAFTVDTDHVELGRGAGVGAVGGLTLEPKDMALMTKGRACSPMVMSA